MATPTIIGTTVLLGFPDGSTITGAIRDNHDIESTADIEYIRDEDNDEVTAIVSNKGTRLTVAGTCKAAVTAKKGETVTVDSVAYLCESATIRYSKLATRFEITLYKPAALATT